MWNVPSRRWEKPLEDWWLWAGLGGGNCGDWLAGILLHYFCLIIIIIIIRRIRISARRPDLMIVKKTKQKNKKQKNKSKNKRTPKRTCRIVNFAVPDGHRVKQKEIEIIKDKLVDLARELKKTMEHERQSETNCNWRTMCCHQRIGTRTGGIRNKRTRWDHLNYSIVEIGQNIRKSPGELRRLAFTHTSEKDHQLTPKNSQVFKW